MNSENREWIVKVSKVISILFHPLFIPLYGLLLIYSSPTILAFIPFRLKSTIFILVVANNVLIPLAIATILYSRGAITRFDTCVRNERVVLLAFAMLMYALSALLLARIQVPNAFRAFFASIAFVTLVTAMITIFFKISLHTAGMGSLLSLTIIGIMLYDIRSVWHLFFVVLGCGTVMTSRLYLDSHRSSGVWAGFFTGAGVMILSMYYLLR
jgi:hypothetical protein